MKANLFVLVSLVILSSCAGKVANSDADLESAGRPANKAYGITFVNLVGGQHVDIVVSEGRKTVAKATCKYSMVGAPSVGGPVTGQIVCNDARAKLKGTFNTLESDSSNWVGTMFFGDNSAARQYGCSHRANTGNFLDCNYKGSVEPPSL